MTDEGKKEERNYEGDPQIALKVIFPVSLSANQVNF